MKFNLRKILKVSLLLIACAMSLAILSACNGTQNTLPSEHFEGNCIKKGYTRFYKPNGTYIDREDAEFGPHSYDDGTVISELSCTTNGETKYVCEFCKNERIDTVEKLGHDYKTLNHLDATCTEDGSNDLECKRCEHKHLEVLPKLGHDNEETVTQEPSCTAKGSKILDCKRCGLRVTEDIDMLPHDFKETVITPATCTAKGSKSMTCRNCLKTEIGEIAMLPHTLDGEVLNDNDAHWSVCAVCANIYDYGEHVKESTQVAATCIDHAYTHIKCRDCNYYQNIIDENSKLSHRYEAYTCLGCQRDEILDHKTEFDSKGTDQSNLIDIKSEEMLVCFYDYLIAYQITEPKYIKVSSYTTVYSNKKSIDAFLANVRGKSTATNWSVRTMYPTSFQEVPYFYMSMSNSDKFVLADAATYTPNDYPAGYKEKAYAQYQSYQFEKNDSARSESFDNFAYKSRINKMTVSSSDQLFFAFEHGYKPEAQTGTAAYRMLEKAKTVARRIINDGMSELEKVRAIYSYLVSDVAYDYGIVALTDTIPYAKCSAYYLEGVFDYGMAVCDGISKAFCVLAGLENIKCVRVTSDNHAWNRVYIDVNGDGEKAWFGSDATWGNQGILYDQNSGKYGEYLSLEDFLFTDSQKENRGQTAKNYIDTGADAVTAENPFEYFYFAEAEDATCDFVITSKDELSALSEYLKANFTGFSKGDIATVNIFIVTTYLAKNDISSTVYRELRSLFGVAISVGENAITYGEITGYSVSIFIPKRT